MAASKKTRKRKRLKDIQSFEIAGVSRGANGGRYIIAKEDGSMRLDLNKLTELHATLGKVITVCKSGTPAAETVEALGKDLAQIHTTLASMMGNDATFDPVGLKSRIDGIKELATSLGGSTHDLNVQDQLDSLLEQVKALDTQIAAMQVSVSAVSTDEGEDDTDEGAADDAASGDQASDDAGQQAATDDQAGSSDAAGQAAEGEGAASDAGDAGQQAAEGEGEEEGQQAAAEPETVTKADLLNFGKELGTQLGAALKEGFGQLATTLKSAPGANPRGMILPGGAGSDGGSNSKAPKDDPDAYDEAHWGNSFDLLAD